MGEITVKSLYMDDLQRFKISRSGISIHSVRAKLVEKHREVLPRDFVIKYEWGAFVSIYGLSAANPRTGKGLQELREDVQLEEVLQSLEDSGNSSPLRLYLSGETVCKCRPPIKHTLSPSYSSWQRELTQTSGVSNGKQ